MTISLWLVLSASWIAAVVMALLAAGAPFPLTWSGRRTGGKRELLAGPPDPGGHAVAVARLLLAAAVAMRAVGCLVWEFCRDQREHAGLVAATGQPGPEPGVAILDHDGLAIYCLPCGRNQIVVSSGAITELTASQLRAVLAHKRAHLRHHHHLMLALAAALAHAFPCVPLLNESRPALARLAEMAADDAAARRNRRDDLAVALVVLAQARARTATLAASGPAAVARLERLMAPPGHPRTASARLAAIAALMIPGAIACLPLLIAACDIAAHP